jgi:N-acetylglucosamine kinase-like BadF-type ATPase
MILIADSGSTKTHWVVLSSDIIENEVFTDGINPFYQTESEIQELIQTQLLIKINAVSISSIFFYGAGCSFDEKKAMIRNGLATHFGKIAIEVESDLLGAARGLFQHEQGIACILGTGSNSCYYNGNEIISNVSPLGFILGDEGSGAVLSKIFMADCLKNQVSEEIKAAFFEKYKLTSAEVLENVYKKPFPNRYLAQFAPFLSENIQHPEVRNIVYDSFVAFFERNVQQYFHKELITSFVGSVAFHLRPILAEAALHCGITIGKIEKSPMSGLVVFHKQGRVYINMLTKK